jgi:hypothetical protein
MARTMAGKRYYTLAASLPRLVHFERAERLAINRQRLEQRLGNLSPGHAAQLSAAEQLVGWQQQPAGRTDAEVVALYRKVSPTLDNDALRDFVRFRMGQRTVLAALRRRQRGERPPASDNEWGVPPRAQWLSSHWDAPDFGLSGHYPWIGQARELLEARSAWDLERLLMNVMWERLGRIADQQLFGFEEVFAFVFKWDIVNRWLSYQADAAVERFRELVTEGMREHQEHAG